MRTNPSNIYSLRAPILRVSGWTLFLGAKKINVDLEELSNTDILLGIWQRKEDFLLLNHLVILAK